MLRQLSNRLSIHRTNSIADIVGISRFFREKNVSSEMLKNQSFVNVSNSVNWNV